MKSSIVITLIICGTVLIVAPFIHNAIVMGQLTKTMIEMERPVNLTGIAPDILDTVCWVIGAAMIGLGAFAGRRGQP